MAKDFATDDDRGPFSDAEVARVVLALDYAITWFRRAHAMGHLVEGRPVSLPVKPTRIELAVFTSLAQIYGRTIVDDQRYLPVLDMIAECGAVALVQRVLWGEAPSDQWLARQQQDLRVAFEILCGTWPDVFMGQAHAELTRLGLPTLVPPMFRDLPRAPSAGEGDDEAERDA
ncbi:hypothetical protein [Caballeronia sp. HLA56]